MLPKSRVVDEPRLYESLAQDGSRKCHYYIKLVIKPKEIATVVIIRTADAGKLDKDAEGL